jgi:hypothetical protein
MRISPKRDPKTDKLPPGRDDWRLGETGASFPIRVTLRVLKKTFRPRFTTPS